MEGTTSPETGSAFEPGSGAEGQPELTDEYLFSDEDSSEAKETPEGVTPEGQQPEPAPPEQETEVVAEETPGSVEEQTQEEPRRYADVFESVEKLEEGYKNALRLNTRTAQQRQAAEYRAQQLEQALQRAMPYLQNLQNQQAPQAQTSDVDLLDDPQQLVQSIKDQAEQAARQLTQEELAKAREQWQADQFSQQTSQAIDTFRGTHPEVIQGSELDIQMAQMIMNLSQQGESFDITPQSLETVYEVVKDPALYELVERLDLYPEPDAIEAAKEALGNPQLSLVYKANPDLILSAEGRELARVQAQFMGGVQQAPSRVPQMTPEQQRVMATVETGGSGAPASAAPGPQHPIDEAVTWDQGRKKSIWG